MSSKEELQAIIEKIEDQNVINYMASMAENLLKADSKEPDTNTNTLEEKKYTPEQMDLINGCIYDALGELDVLPDILTMAIQNYELDVKEMNALQADFIISEHHKIYSAMVLVRGGIYRAIEKLDIWKIHFNTYMWQHKLWIEIHNSIEKIGNERIKKRNNWNDWKSRWYVDITKNKKFYSLYSKIGILKFLHCYGIKNFIPLIINISLKLKVILSILVYTFNSYKFDSYATIDNEA